MSLKRKAGLGLAGLRFWILGFTLKGCTRIAKGLGVQGSLHARIINKAQKPCKTLRGNTFDRARQQRP